MPKPVASAKTPNPTSAAFGARVRALREGLGWSQERLAREAGVSRDAISILELGKRDVRLTNVVRLAAALQCSAGDLVNDLPVPPPDDDF
jgi:transcriptional regulator with XRE-family HTH domain